MLETVEADPVELGSFARLVAGLLEGSHVKILVASLWRGEEVG